uniref:C2H2-type domain-containing protein n=1 Tax=Haptolina brevifila TaxID=156173 RepID=A0A7S2MPD2_9EUKA|mmetsp:Transcript_56019/g.111204  ORF Transcript_56019/g.111204 Transcript_56019/m.111204 type:complete len:380 (+) Transcript_56019:53-1192(+)
MVAISREGMTSAHSSPKIQGIKGTVTRYRCGFPNCNKRYASTDGVRKHARKTHMLWLKAIDESASSRDRQLESKPSTYCVMEVTDDTDDIELENESPAQLPAPAPMIPSLSHLRVACSENMLSMPEGSLLGGGRDSISDAMAAATAACLAGAAPPLPLAWLLSNSAGMGAMAGMPPPTTAQALSHATGSMRSDLPVAVASAPVRMAVPSPLWNDAVGAALAGVPASPLPPAVSPGAWTPELMSLFSGGATEQEAPRAIIASSVAEDPLCLDSYYTPPISSTAEKACVSPFELEKRPAPLSPTPAESKACTTLAEDDTYNLFDDGQPFMKEASGLPWLYHLSRADLPPAPFPSAHLAFCHRPAPPPQAEYTEFLETLLAL